MHAYSFYEDCLTAIEFEEEHLKERVATKSQSSANFAQDHSNAKSSKKSNNRKDAPKPKKSKNVGPPVRLAVERSPTMGAKPNPSVTYVVSPITFLVIA